MEVPQNRGDLRIRLVCRLRPRANKIEDLFEALKTSGWEIDGVKLSKEGFEAEILSSSLRGDEIIFSLRSADPKILENFVRAAIQECWYIDIYYHLRAGAAEEVAENLGIKLDEKGFFRVKEANVSLKVESFPNTGALTISYRVGWSEVNRNALKKVHERLIRSKSSKGLLGKIVGWMR